MALSNETKRLRAQDLYVYSDFNMTDIAEICEVSDKTLRVWRDKYGWQELKKSHAVTSPRIIAQLQQAMFSMSEDKQQAVGNADKLVKLASAIEKLQGRQLYLANYIEVFQDFTAWMFTRGDHKKKLETKSGRLEADGVQAGKLLNLWMKDFINTKIHGKA